MASLFVFDVITGFYCPARRRSWRSCEASCRHTPQTVQWAEGNVEPLIGIIEDTQASHWSRSAALDAWKIRVLEGDSSREGLLSYLISRGDVEATRLLSIEGGYGDLQLLNCIVLAAIGIGANEMRERIDGWYDNHLIDTLTVSQKYVHQRLSTSFESCRERLRERQSGYIRDVSAEMGGMHGFREKIEKKSANRGYVPLEVPISPKIGRNDPCHCGSGKKFKKCHGVG